MIISCGYIFGKQISAGEIPYPVPINQYNVEGNYFVDNILFNYDIEGDDYWGWNSDHHQASVSKNDFWFNTQMTTDPDRAEIIITQVILFEADGTRTSYGAGDVTLDLILRAYDYFMSADKASGVYFYVTLDSYGWRYVSHPNAWNVYSEGGDAYPLFSNTARFKQDFTTRCMTNTYLETNVPIFIPTQAHWVYSGSDAEFALNINEQMRQAGILGHTLYNP